MHINQRVTPSQVERSTDIKIGNTRAPAPTETQPPVTSNPQAFVKHPEQTQPPIQSETEVHEIQQGVKQSSPQTMLSESEGLPRPKILDAELQAKAGQLKKVETLDRSGLLESTKAQYLSDSGKDQAGLKETTILSHDVERVTREVPLTLLADQAKGPVQHFNEIFVRYAQSGQAEAFLAEKLSGALKDLDKADTLIGGDKNIAKSNQRTQDQVKNMIAGLSSQLNLSVFLAGQSDDQLRQVIMSAIGQNKGYDLTQTANLSQKKLLFVEAVLKGLKAGLPQQTITGSDIKGNPVPEGHGGELYKALPKHSPEITARIKNVLAGLAPGSDLAWTLTLKTGPELNQLMNQALGGNVSQSYVKSLVEIINQNLPDRLSTNLVDTGTKGQPMPDTMTLNGKSYIQPKYLAEGGFGKIYTYVNAEDPNDKVVVKSAIPQDGKAEEVRKSTVDEINAHREILGTGHQNIIGLKGAIKTPEDQLYIVMEFASGGNLKQASEKLQDSLNTGLISADTRNLLGKFLLRGVFEGTRHMQDVTQSHHGDFKTPNILIGADGQVKLTDFGNSGTGLERTMFKKMVDNPQWLSPEYVDKDFSLIQKREKNETYVQFYREHSANIEATYELATASDLKDRVDKALAKYSLESVKELHPEIYKQVSDGKSINNKEIEVFGRLRESHPELAESLLPRAKAAKMSDVFQVLKKEGVQNLKPLKETSMISFNLMKHYMNDGPSGEQYLRYVNHGIASQAGAGITLDMSKVDTWATGVVAVELLVSSLENTQRSDFAVARKLGFDQSFLSKIGDKISELGAEDKRLMAGSQDLNLQTLAANKQASIQELATAYSQDPRFSGPAHLQMFDVLTRPQPPLGPKDDSPQAHSEYQTASSRYKADHGLDDQGLATAQQNYSQALQQFKAVLQTEMGVGVTAQDRLINGLTHPDPSKRITMEAALKNSVFDDPRLNMPETRQLWQALNTNPPDANRIKELVGSLGL